MRTALIAAFSLCWIAGAAVGQTVPPPLKAPDASPAAGKKKGKMKGDLVEKAPPPLEGKNLQDAYASCLEIWDSATHMNRREWDRACRRVAERLKEMADMVSK